MILRTALSSIPLGAALALTLALPGASPSSSAQGAGSIALVGADAVIDGNSGAALGQRDPCVRTEVGSSVTVDFVVDEVPADRSVIGFQMNIAYDPSFLDIVAANNDLFLGATGQYQPFAGLSDPLPDTDGNYLVAIADLASNNPNPGDNNETGPGVLSRVTFQAKAPGRATVGPNVSLGDPNNQQYPQIQDQLNNQIQVDSIATAVIAIGQDCGAVPPAEQVTPLPPLTEILGTGTPAAGGATTPPGGDGGSLVDTPTPEGQTPEPTATASDASDTPSPTPEVTPGDFPDAGGDDSDTTAIVLAALLAVGGVAMAGFGGYILYRRANGS